MMIMIMVICFIMKSIGRVTSASPPGGRDPPTPRRDPHPSWGWEDPSPLWCPLAAGRNSGSLESLTAAPPPLPLHSTCNTQLIILTQYIMTLGNWNGLGSIHYPTANSNLLHFHSVLRIQERIKSQTKSHPESHRTVLVSLFSTA